MRYLDRSTEDKITKKLLEQALSLTATENGMAVDKETIVDLSAKVLGGQNSLPRSKMRRVLDKYTDEINERVSIPLKLNSIVDEVMLALERNEKGLVSRSDL